MNIRTRYRLATSTVLAAVAIIAASIWWTNAEVAHAIEQRAQATQIVRRLTELRLMTLEYAIAPHERVRVQWHVVSERLDDLLAKSRFSSAREIEILTAFIDRREKVKRIFGELSSARRGPNAQGGGAEVAQRFEAQLFNQLLILQQDSLTDAFRLGDLATGHIDTAQTRVVAVILAGLGLIALIKLGTYWVTERYVLGPIIGLQRAAAQIASGNPGPKFELGGADEVGRLARSLDQMTQSQHQSATQLQRQNQELGTLNKELESFSYSVSHDLRAPLRAMDGFSMILLEDHAGQLNEEGKAALARIRAASQRMGALIDDLLRLANVARARLELKPVDLGVVTREIADSVAQAHPGRQVRWEIGEGMTLQADPSLIAIAMRNLLENAWKFSGKVAQAVIRVGVRVQDGRRAFFVADNGAGFDPAYASRLFEVFQRLHHASEFDGTGIGLAIVQRIVHRHGGRVWAESKPGDGATFYFTVGEANG